MRKQKVIKQTETRQQEVKSIHGNLVNALENYEKSKVDVAMAFWNAYDKREENGAYCWQNLGYGTFREYVEQEFGFEYRNAMYYVKIGKTIEQVGITKEEIDEMGWSKFKEISSLLLSDLDRKTFETIKSRLKNKTVKETREFLEKLEVSEVKESIETIKKCRMTFNLTEEQIRIVKDALDKAMGISGCENENLALEYICANFLAEE